MQRQIQLILPVLVKAKPGASRRAIEKESFVSIYMAYHEDEELAS